MQKQFTFFTLSYFFKQLVFCNVRTNYGFYHLILNSQLNIYMLYQTLYASLLLYKNFLSIQNQIFLLSSTGIGRYNYQLFQYTNYFLNPRLDPREYTTRISTLARRPYLNLFGMIKQSSGLYLNLSSYGALVLRHLAKTQNVAASVALTKPTSRFCIDYPLSLQHTRVNEKYYLQLLVSMADKHSLMTKVSQHFLYYRQIKRS